jgi:hypothetical protein
MRQRCASDGQWLAHVVQGWHACRIFATKGDETMPRRIAGTEKYAGQYVAFRSRDDDTVVAADRALLEVIKKAKAAGVDKPVIARVPDRDSVLIY